MEGIVGISVHLQNEFNVYPHYTLIEKILLSRHL